MVETLYRASDGAIFDNEDAAQTHEYTTGNQERHYSILLCYEIINGTGHRLGDRRYSISITDTKTKYVTYHPINSCLIFSAPGVNGSKPYAVKIILNDQEHIEFGQFAGFNFPKWPMDMFFCVEGEYADEEFVIGLNISIPAGAYLNIMPPHKND
jgi:hypothetical protein